jgi:hypothetical protein
MIDPMDQPDPMDLATARCRARARSGARCRRWPIAGGTVCVSHGGKAPQVARVAAERLDLARLVYAARLYSPEDVMEQCVRIARALLDVAVQSGRLVDVADALDRAARVAHLALRSRTGGQPQLTVATVDREIARLRAQLDSPTLQEPELSDDELDAHIARLHAELDDDGR